MQYSPCTPNDIMQPPSAAGCSDLAQDDESLQKAQARMDQPIAIRADHQSYQFRNELQQLVLPQSRTQATNGRSSGQGMPSAANATAKATTPVTALPQQC